MGLHLSEEFWIAADALAGHRMMQSPTQQQVSVQRTLAGWMLEHLGCLGQLCRICGWNSLSVSLLPLYSHVSGHLVNTIQCSRLLRIVAIRQRYLFDELKKFKSVDSLLHVDTGGPTCWNRIFQAFLLYRNTYRPDTLLNQQGPTSFAGNSSTSAIKSIAPKEVTALIAVLNLIEVIASQVTVVPIRERKRRILLFTRVQDEISRIGFFEHPQWQITGAFFGLLSCRVSLDLKAALLNTLSAFTKTPEIAIHFWKIIGDIGVINRFPC